MTLGGVHVRLYGGPEDGGTVWMPAGGLPARVGVHRTATGGMVPIRARTLLEHPDAAGHVAIYEHLTTQLFRAWCVLLGTDAADWVPVDEATPVYVWRELATRWLAAP